MYNILIYLYLLGVAIYSFFDEKVRKMWRGERAAFGVLKEKVDPQAEYVWFHAASLGEFEQGRPLPAFARLHYTFFSLIVCHYLLSDYSL